MVNSNSSGGIDKEGEEEMGGKGVEECANSTSECCDIEVTRKKKTKTRKTRRGLTRSRKGLTRSRR